MHQQPRHPPRVSSPANSPQTNPTRTNNQREGIVSASRSRAGSEATPREAGLGAAAPDGADGAMGPSRESIKKLDQIIQNFYLKAAVLILQSRIPVTPTPAGRGKKTNKWFQIETDDIEDFKDELRVWKHCGSFEHRPPPMIIETYLDVSELSPSQTLVVLDENGQRRDVLEVLNTPESSSEGSPPPKSRWPNTEVILERWKIELRYHPGIDLDDFGPTLPTIYKRSIVFFRSLFITTHIMPVWKFFQQNMTKGAHPCLEVRCRILAGDTRPRSFDNLKQPFFNDREAVTDYMFGDLEVPVGRFSASVTYRNDCNFRVDDSESLLSSRFMSIDDNFFQPSLPQRTEQGRRRDSLAEVGSLPSHRHGRHLSEQQQTYGSLSTFHGGGPLGTSPISALKAVRAVGSDTSSPPESAPASVGPEPPHSLPISGRSSASRPTSLRKLEELRRRPSVSFNPFKAGSLSGSPRTQDEPPPSPHSPTKQSGLAALAQARNRTSLTAGMAASLRGLPPMADPGPSSSPKPSATSRYSSSFTHRRGRPSFGGASRGEDDQVSSGKQSLSSSMAQPGSGLLAEAGGSSGSFQTDDDNISDFLKALESRKTLQSFEAGKKGEAASKRTVAQLSKFQMMRESNIALTDSMNSSMHLHRSSSSSSRQLTAVPGMMNASMSASSSPGKPLSPHTPHTPAIPSRLSENSIIDYAAQGQAARARAAPEIIATEEEETGDPPVSQGGTRAIEIPLSPRLLQTNRRSSSVAQQTRALVDEDDGDAPFGGQRSLSLGADEREPPTLSTLFRLEHDSDDNQRLQPAANIRSSSGPRSSSSTEHENKGPPRGLLSSATPASPHRLRYQGSRQTDSPRRGTPPQSSRASLVGSSGSRYTGVTRGGGLSGGGEGEADDEPLVFDLSELGREPNRRSLEEGRGSAGSGSGRSSADRRGFDSGSRGSRQPWN